MNITCCMSSPRYVNAQATHIILGALFEHQLLPFVRYGAYWHLGLQAVFASVVEEGSADWILAVDCDSLFNAAHIERLKVCLHENPDVDALAGFQKHRGSNQPILGTNERTQLTSPADVDCAHFGLTMLRVQCLRNIPRPWFNDAVSLETRDVIKPDIAFWHRWRNHGYSVHVDEQCRIAHLQDSVIGYNADYSPFNMSFAEWRKQTDAVR